MTITIARTSSTAGSVATGSPLLLALLEESLSAVEEEDLDGLHSTSPAGSALVGLAAIARRAAGALGSSPGVPLSRGPGVVVVRDLVSATRLLGRAAAGSHSADGDLELGRLLPAAKGLHAALLEALTTAA